MNKPVKGTQTEKNILTAFAGESQARNRYEIFAKKAKEDGFILAHEILKETAHQEKEHAERLWKFLEGGVVEIKWSFPAGITSTTDINLGEAAAGEHEEWQDMYPTFAAEADKEGFKEIAATMKSIAVAEKFHEKRFLDLQKWITDGTLFKSKTPVKWRCLNCGFLYEGTEPPAFCPACKHPAGYFVNTELTF